LIIFTVELIILLTLPHETRINLLIYRIAGRQIMIIRNFILAVPLLLFTSPPVGSTKFRATCHPITNAPSSPTQAFPFAIFPQKELFILTEGDASVLVVIGSECPPGVLPDARLDVLPPTPSFVRSGDPCRCSTGGLAQGVIIATPSIGDAGKYEVVVQATACTGFVQLYRFKLKVKRA
jgi:hypothetical protein